MNIRVLCKGLEHTEQLDLHIKKQLHKIVTFLEKEHGPFSIDVTIEFHPHHVHHGVHIRIKNPLFSINTNREGKDLYALINEVCDIAYHDALRQKEKTVDAKKHKGPHKGS